jgi:choline kinase
MRYVILAKGGHEGFKEPRQLSVINGERILDRTIRLLKENGIGSKDIIVTGNYKDLGDVIVYDPLDNDFDYNTESGYWLNAFSNEFLIEPVCFIWGDVYFSENAIKTIVNTDTDSTLFFCSYQNKSHRYIKEWDEPFAYKVIDTELFKKHIDIVKDLYDKGKTNRHPIVWELYRSINGIDVNKHELNDNVVIINDITCDIDTPKDIENIEKRIGDMVRVEVTEEVDVGRFDEITEIVRRNAQNDTKGHLFVGDIVTCNEDLANYLNGENRLGRAFAKVIEVIPDEKKAEKVEVKETKKPVRRTRKTR